MYKKDYHPDENIVFDTKNYGFTSPKSTGLEPLSNALVQIDAALKKKKQNALKKMSESMDALTRKLRTEKQKMLESMDALTRKLQTGKTLILQLVTGLVNI